MHSRQYGAMTKLFICVCLLFPLYSFPLLQWMWRSCMMPLEEKPGTLEAVTRSQICTAFRVWDLVFSIKCIRALCIGTTELRRDMALIGLYNDQTGSLSCDIFWLHWGQVSVHAKCTDEDSLTKPTR